jgi:perosamine synthetase
MPEYDELLSLDIPVIEDAAESIGSKYKNKLCGTFGVTSCFSFHGSKTLTTGEGGMLLTDDDYIYNRCMILRDHGRIPGDTLFQNMEVGYKYKMSNLQAALGLAQLERIDELVAKNRWIFSLYKEALKEFELIQVNPNHPNVDNSYWMTTAMFDNSIQMTKFDIISKLKESGVSTRPFFDPLSSLKAYEGSKDQLRASVNNINGYAVSSRGINLPSAASIGVEDVARIVKKINKIYV